MTVYQAKGLEFPIVIVPSLARARVAEHGKGGDLFPVDLLREGRPSADFNLDEERRLLYVAMTRAEDRLIVTTHGGPNGGELGAVAVRRPSSATASAIGLRRRPGRSTAGLRFVDRTLSRPAAAGRGEHVRRSPASSGRRRPFDAVMPLPTKRERRLALRLRATELLGMLEGDRRSRPRG